METERARWFDEVIIEVLDSRFADDNICYIYGLLNELREAAQYCGLRQYIIEGFWVDEEQYILSAAWICDGMLRQSTHLIYGRDDRYEYPTIVDKWMKED